MEKIMKKEAQSSSSDLSKAMACFIGSAIGDALGAHTEFKKIDYQRTIYKTINDVRKFCCSSRCKQGQWTDDSSMALCLADSLLVNNFEFNGVDLRTRFLAWWHLGYNNGLQNKTSFGLGGNISQSFYDFYKDCSPKTNIKGNNNGNGSLMRLAPIPIAFHSNKKKALQYASE